MPADDDLPLPSLEVLISGTFALMTTWAHTPPDQRCARQPDGDARSLQGLIARKVVSNLFFLMNHPQVGVAMARSLAQAHAQWRQLAESTPPTPARSWGADGRPSGSTVLH